MTDAPRSEAAGGEASHLIVGTVRKPHGIRGELQVTLETDRPTEVFRTGRVLQLGDERGRPLGRRLTVERARPFKDGLILKLVEFGSRSPEVEALRAHSLLIPAEEAAPPADDEVFYHELIGCHVVVDGKRVGTVKDVLPTGGAELLVVRRTGGKELLIPFVKEMVVGIDTERQEVEISPPEGLLDL